MGIEGNGLSLKRKTESDMEKETLKIVREQLGFGCCRLDLLTIYCEGCEFDVTEMLTLISLVQKIDHIQLKISFNQTNEGCFKEAGAGCRLKNRLQELSFNLCKSNNHIVM